jgi:hypothetical protein
VTDSPISQPPTVKRRWGWIVAGVLVVGSVVGVLAAIQPHQSGQPDQSGQPHQSVIQAWPGGPFITIHATIPLPPAEKIIDAYGNCGSKGQLLSLPDGLNIVTSKGPTVTYVDCILQNLDAPSSLDDELTHTLVGETRVDKWGSEGPGGTATFTITWHVDDKGILYVSIMDNRQG